MRTSTPEFGGGMIRSQAAVSILIQLVVFSSGERKTRVRPDTPLLQPGLPLSLFSSGLQSRASWLPAPTCHYSHAALKDVVTINYIGNTRNEKLVLCFFMYKRDVERVTEVTACSLRLFF